MIRQRHYSPEYAVSRTLRRYAQVFQNLENRYLAERANDIFDIEKRLLRHLLGRRREGLSHLTSPVLVLAHNLTPSETANLDREFVHGFVTEVGGLGSHTAIVAEALEIPAVVGTGPFLTDVSGGDLVIIDGDQGLVILHPDEETIARYRHEARRIRTLAVQLESLRDLAGRDGRRRANQAVRQHRVSRTRSTTASSAAPTASACTGPSSSTLAPKTNRTRRSTYEAYCRVVQDDGPTVGHHPHVRPGGGQDRALAQPRGGTQPLPRTAEHPAGAAQFADVPDATPGDPSRQRVRPGAGHVSAGHHACWSFARRRWCWPT